MSQAEIILLNEKGEVQQEHLKLDAEVVAKLNSNSHTRQLTKRLVLYTGFKCNLRCQFCYYLKSIEDGSAENFELEGLLKKIKQARDFGLDEIDFTGGEATIHPGFLEMVKYSKEIGFKTVNVITNGLRMADIEYCKKLAEAGLDEVLLSIHSHKKALHENLTKVPGSYDKILQAADNANALGIRLRINSVVNHLNYNEVEDYLRFIKKYSPHSVNLIVFNPSEETPGYDGHNEVQFDTYDQIGKAIGFALDNHKKDLRVVSVRFIPYCFLKGHEDTVRTYWQEIYEKEEWDPVFHWAFRKGWWFSIGATIAGLLILPFNRNYVLTGKKSWYTFFAEVFQNLRIKYLFRKKDKCGSCKMRKICPGIPKDFNSKHPDIKVNPYLDDDLPVVINPMFWNWSTPDKFASIKKDLKK